MSGVYVSGEYGNTSSLFMFSGNVQHPFMRLAMCRGRRMPASTVKSGLPLGVQLLMSQWTTASVDPLGMHCQDMIPLPEG